MSLQPQLNHGWPRMKAFFLFLHPLSSESTRD